jgi:hypothetical protein
MPAIMDNTYQRYYYYPLFFIKANIIEDVPSIESIMDIKIDLTSDEAGSFNLMN